MSTSAPADQSHHRLVFTAAVVQAHVQSVPEQAGIDVVVAQRGVCPQWPQPSADTGRLRSGHQPFHPSSTNLFKSLVDTLPRPHGIDQWGELCPVLERPFEQGRRSVPGGRANQTHSTEQCAGHFFTYDINFKSACWSSGVLRNCCSTMIG